MLPQCLYKRQGDTGVNPVNSYSVIKGLEYMTHEENRRLRGNFVSVPKYLMEEVQTINIEKPFIHEEI